QDHEYRGTLQPVLRMDSFCVGWTDGRERPGRDAKACSLHCYVDTSPNTAYFVTRIGNKRFKDEGVSVMRVQKIERSGNGEVSYVLLDTNDQPIEVVSSFLRHL